MFFRQHLNELKRKWISQFLKWENPFSRAYHDIAKTMMLIPSWREKWLSEIEKLLNIKWINGCENTWDVIWACSSFVADLMPCWVMNVFSTPVSVFCGYPKSKISIEYEIFVDWIHFWNKLDNNNGLTIQQFIDKHKIVFDILLRYFTKIRMHHIDDLE